MYLSSCPVHLEEDTETWTSTVLDEDVKLFCRMTDCLAILPENGVPDGMAYLQDNIPNGVEPLLRYFDGTCVSGTYRQIQLPELPDDTIPLLHMRCKPPMYPPSMYNGNNITLHGGSRTNNVWEGWNHAFPKLVERVHPTIWWANDSIRNN